MPYMGDQLIANEAPEASGHIPDPAGIFAAALSLWEAFKKCESGEAAINLSECYNGMDQLMREVMRVADLFESWACSHVAFEELDDVWPYLMEDKFGTACMAVMTPGSLAEYGENECLSVALRLRLPVKLSDKLPIPIDVIACNPVPGTAFHAFRIQTVRRAIEDDYAVPFTLDDEPFDEEFEAPFFGLYGVDQDGILEHIADRATYAEALNLVRNLVPGIEFPDNPFFIHPIPPGEVG